MEESEKKAGVDQPSEETLRQQLQIQWNDHIQTREQTWRSLNVEIAMFLAIIGADVTLDNPLTLVPLAGILFVSTMFSIAVTIHHRKVQTNKFRIIFEIEKKLGIHALNVFSGIREPAPFHFKQIFDFRRLATPTFILVMHVLILIFSISYVAMRILG